MLDRDAKAGGTPLPKVPANGSADSLGRDPATALSDIRTKAGRIVSLLSGIDAADGLAGYNLSLAEQLAQEIADLCPPGADPLI